jgi:peptidoglycan/LPS O-acetylase OafA/YrhL
MMEQTSQKSTTWRSVGAVVGGLLFIFAASTLVDVVLHSSGVFPPWGQAMSDSLFGLAVAYRLIIQVAGCYLTARLATDRPMKHAVWLGALGVVLSAIATAATWNKGPEFGPHWYPIVLLLSSLPCAWVGGKLYESRHPEKA